MVNEIKKLKIKDGQHQSVLIWIGFNNCFKK